MESIGKNKTTESIESTISNTGELREAESLIDCFRIISTMSIGIAYLKIIFDEFGKPFDFQFLKVNPAFEQIMGLKGNEVVGRTGLEVFSNIEQYWIDTFGKVAITGEPVQLRGYFGNLKKYFAVDVFSSQKEFCGVAFTDITEIKIQQIELNKLNDLQKMMNTVRTILLETSNEKMLCQKVCNTLLEIDFVKIAGIGLLNEKSLGLDVVNIAASEEYRDYINSNVKLDLDKLFIGTIRTVLETGKTVVVNKIIEDNRFAHYKEYISKINLKSVITLPLLHEGMILGVLQLYSDQEGVFGTNEVAFLEKLSTDIAIGLKAIRLSKELRGTNRQLKKAVEDILTITSRMLESRDPYTVGHQRRVAQLSVAIAEQIGLAEEKIEMINLSALVHDIGKIAVPAEILVKPTRLSQNEINLIKEHPLTGYNFLKDLVPPWSIIAQIALQHHEKLDGSGYPRGIKEEEMLLEAKIVAVADVVEAISNHRPYRPALGIDKALEEIANGKGNFYDPVVVDACIKLFKDNGFKFD